MGGKKGKRRRIAVQESEHVVGCLRLKDATCLPSDYGLLAKAKGGFKLGLREPQTILSNASHLRGRQKPITDPDCSRSGAARIPQLLKGLPFLRAQITPKVRFVHRNSRLAESHITYLGHQTKVTATIMSGIGKIDDIKHHFIITQIGRESSQRWRESTSTYSP
jgi:hypothetical protein